MREILIKINKSKGIKSTLSVLSYAAVILSVISFLTLLFITSRRSLTDAAIVSLTSAIAFLLVTLTRIFINAKRPYEVYGFYEVRPKKKLGRSFPSRHVFSIFLIATLTLSLSMIFSAVLFLFGIILAASRVLLGIHFIRDTVAGAIIGVISGICTLSLLYFL